MLLYFWFLLASLQITDLMNNVKVCDVLLEQMELLQSMIRMVDRIQEDMHAFDEVGFLCWSPHPDYR